MNQQHTRLKCLVSGREFNECARLQQYKVVLSGLYYKKPCMLYQETRNYISLPQEGQDTRQLL